MRPPRRLRPDEIELWRQVTATVVPRESVSPPAPEPEPPRPVEAPAPAPLSPAPRPRPAANPYSPLVQTPRPAPFAAFERRFKNRVERGRIGIDAKIDLHGMTQAEAHGALIHFLLHAQRHDARLVLVVTGKGHLERLRADGATEAGVLRRAVPHWLRDRVLKGVVLGFEEAGRGHGGEGALYIRLRRRQGDD